MARAGGGSRGGGRSSGGGRSMSRSGGGHRVGGSSSGRRAGSGSSFGGSSFGGSSYRGGPRSAPHYSGPRRVHRPPTPPRYGYRGGPGMPPPPPRTRYYRRSSGGGCLSSILAWIIVFFVVIVAMVSTLSRGGRGSSSYADDSKQISTIAREKLETDNAYINNCIIDELGWFDNESKTESELKEFWKETGVQPYIILRDYDASLTTDAEKEQWTIDYYDANFDAENIFLYVYFAEEDTDNDVGYMCYANGMETSSVMDTEAVDIFWNYIDKYWYTDMSTDDLFVAVFEDTADTIMHVSTTGADVAKWAFIAVAVIAGGGIVISLVNKRNKRAKEEAEEQQKILETPINDIAEDELTKKYTE